MSEWIDEKSRQMAAMVERVNLRELVRNAPTDAYVAGLTVTAPAEPAISDAAWEAMSQDDALRSLGDCPDTLVLRTRQEWEERGSSEAGAAAVVAQKDEAIAGLRQEIERLKAEIAGLERSRNHCEFCDAIIAVKAVKPGKTPLSALTYVQPLEHKLGGDMAR